MKITFDEVKGYVMNNCPEAQRWFFDTQTYTGIERIIDSTEPFVMDYVDCPVGYAETNNLNDIDELTKEINEHFKEFSYVYDGRVRRGIINRIVKTEISRWNEGRNAWYYGRHIGRLAYLLNKDGYHIKLREELEERKRRVLSYTTFM